MERSKEKESIVWKPEDFSNYPRPFLIHRQNKVTSLDIISHLQLEFSSSDVRFILSILAIVPLSTDLTEQSLTKHLFRLM